jgi:hypothetical protein
MGLSRPVMRLLLPMSSDFKKRLVFKTLAKCEAIINGVERSLALTVSIVFLAKKKPKFYD